MHTSTLEQHCLVFRRGADCRLGATFLVGARRYRVVREISDWGRQAVIARPCRWYDGLALACTRAASAWRRGINRRRAWAPAQD